MSQPASHPPDPEPAHDDVPGRPIAWSIVLTLAAILLTVGVVWGLTGGHVRGGGRSAIAHLGLPIGTATFETATPFERWRAARRQALASWQGAGPGHAKVRVPIDVAIARYVAAHQAPAAPAASPPPTTTGGAP